MSEPIQNGDRADGNRAVGYQENRRHFLVDINTVLGLFGKRYFLIFYFGRHLHPRQREQLVNQRRAGNWVVIFIILMLLAGFVLGVMEVIAWRMGNASDNPAGAGSFTELSEPHTLRV